MNRVENWPGRVPSARAVRAAARATLDTRRPAPAGELSITFLAADEIRELNRRFLGKDHATDVLAFDLGDEDRLLGDVYISPEVAAEAAAEAGIPVPREVLRLVVHGVLHLLGHEHPEDETRYDSDMFRLQEELLDGLDAPGGGDAPHDPRGGGDARTGLEA